MSLHGLATAPLEISAGRERIAGLALAIALHVIVVVALVAGLVQKPVKERDTLLMVSVLEAPSPSRVRPSRPTPPRAPVPDPHVEASAAPRQPEGPEQSAPDRHPPAVAAQTSPVLDQAHFCPTPAYPSIARRLEESGTVTLHFLIGVDGRVVSGTISHTSGYRLLDNTALHALSMCRFKNGTMAGKPIQSWATLKYVWRLND